MKLAALMMAARRRKVLLLIALSIAAVILIDMPKSSGAQSPEERQIENKIPKHVPISITITDEKSVKDVKNDRWLRDLKLEVTNLSDKPIYFLNLWIELPEVHSEAGYPVGFPLRYGRMEFIHFNTAPLPDDKPVPPKGVYTFEIPEIYHQGWEAHIPKENRTAPRKIILSFGQLSFGDGSGFNGTHAKPYPYRKDRASASTCRDGPKQANGRTRTTTASPSQANHIHCPSWESSRLRSTTKNRNGWTGMEISLGTGPWWMTKRIPGRGAGRGMCSSSLPADGEIRSPGGRCGGRSRFSRL